MRTAAQKLKPPREIFLGEGLVVIPIFGFHYPVALRVEIVPIQNLDPLERIGVAGRFQLLIASAVVPGVQRVVSNDPERHGGERVLGGTEHLVEVLVVAKGDVAHVEATPRRIDAEAVVTLRAELIELSAY